MLTTCTGSTLAVEQHLGRIEMIEKMDSRYAPWTMVKLLSITFATSD